MVRAGRSWAYMEHCERVNYRIMEEFERLGVEFAFPSRTVYVKHLDGGGQAFKPSGTGNDRGARGRSLCLGREERALAASLATRTVASRPAKEAVVAGSRYRDNDRRLASQQICRILRLRMNQMAFA